MKITHVDSESMTAPQETFCVDVDNEAINQYLISHWCFDILLRPETVADVAAIKASNVVDDIALSDSHGCAVELSEGWGSF